MHDPANCWQLAPSPDGKGWGEENLNSTIFCFTPLTLPSPARRGDIVLRAEQLQFFIRFPKASVIPAGSAGIQAPWKE